MKWQLLILILLTIPTVLADVSTNKQEYIAGETLQLKLTLSEKPLTDSFTINIIKDNKKTKLGAITLKISDTEYQFYLDLPSNTEKGEYTLSIENILFIKNNQLIEEKEQSTIKIETINEAYNWLNNQDTETNIIDNSMSILALDNIGFPIDSSYLLSQQDIQGCFPKDNCKVKETAFALLALKQLKLQTEKTINWLESAQNTIDKGTYTLKITSEIEGTCTINKETLQLPITKNIEPSETQQINCTSIPSIELIHTYLGSINTITSSNKKLTNITINNEGCFGTEFKSDCNYKSSLYAAYSLNKNNPELLIYLKNNYDDFTTLHHVC